MFRKIIKKIKSITKSYPISTFRIVDISGDPKNRNTLITYQVSGKSTTIVDKPSQLIKELVQIKGFSEEDSQVIYSLSVAEEISSSFRILSIIFLEEAIKFEIEDLNSNYTFLLTAEEIVSTKTILENMSPSNISMIYFQLIDTFQQKQQINKQRQQKHQHEIQGKIYFLPGINK